MARLNVAGKSYAFTHEGAPAVANIKPVEQLRRLVMSTLLWEKQLYVDGTEIAEAITKAAQNVSLNDLAQITHDARHKFHLRHVPLLLLTILAKRGAGHPSGGVATVTRDVISRADEMAELLAIYWQQNPGKPVPAQIKKGLQMAFEKFDEYQLSKWKHG